MNFSEWTEEDVIKHNNRIRGLSNKTIPPKEEKPKKVPKYRNEKVIVDGVVYDSKKEANKAEELEYLEKAGKIKNLERQKKFVLQEAFRINGHKIREIAYVADFVYEEDGKLVVVDVKSPITRKNPVYKLKKKMMLYVHGIEIKEV
jgi:hypothetical protein